MDLPAKKRLVVLHKTTDKNDKKVAKADYAGRLRKQFEKFSGPLPVWAQPEKSGQKKRFGKAV